MKEKLISYKTAQLAKEKGFDWKHADFYIDKDANGDYTDLPCVPQSLLQKYLRDEHGIQMIIKPFWDSLSVPRCTYSCDVMEIEKTGHMVRSHRCDTYEDALEEALVNGLNMIETKL